MYINNSSYILVWHLNFCKMGKEKLSAKLAHPEFPHPHPEPPFTEVYEQHNKESTASECNLQLRQTCTRRNNNPWQGPRWTIYVFMSHCSPHWWISSHSQKAAFVRQEEKTHLKAQEEVRVLWERCVIPDVIYPAWTAQKCLHGQIHLLLHSLIPANSAVELSLWG